LDLSHPRLFKGPAVQPDSVDVIRRFPDRFLDEARLSSLLELLNYLAAGPITDWLQLLFFLVKGNILISTSIGTFFGALGFIKKPFQEFFLFSLRRLFDNLFQVSRFIKLIIERAGLCGGDRVKFQVPEPVVQVLEALKCAILFLDLCSPAWH